jgi:hypothetical protein
VTDRSVEAVFEGDPDGLAILEAIRTAIAAIGAAEMRVSRTQVAFGRRRGFACVWRPGRWLRGPRPPAVLSVALAREDASVRWKEVVHPSPRVWMHHLEVHRPDEVDGAVRRWLEEAWTAAG